MRYYHFGFGLLAIAGFIVVYGVSRNLSNPIASDTLFTTGHVTKNISSLIESLPDGNDIKTRYQAARRIDDVTAANQDVRAEIEKVQQADSNLTRIHIALMNSCNFLNSAEIRQLDGIVSKVQSFRKSVVDVGDKMQKSLGTFRMKSKSPSRVVNYKSEQAVTEYELAYNEFNRLRVDAQEKTKAIEALVVNIRSTSAACAPTEIPPLFEESNVPSAEPVTEKSVQIIN